MSSQDSRNFRGTHILGASRGRLCDSSAFLFAVPSDCWNTVVTNVFGCNTVGSKSLLRLHAAEPYLFSPKQSTGARGRGQIAIVTAIIICFATVKKLFEVRIGCLVVNVKMSVEQAKAYLASQSIPQLFEV